MDSIDDLGFFFGRDAEEFANVRADAVVELFAERFVAAAGLIENNLFHPDHGHEHCAEAHGVGVLRDTAAPIVKRIHIDSAQGNAIGIHR